MSESVSQCYSAILRCIEAINPRATKVRWECITDVDGLQPEWILLRSDSEPRLEFQRTAVRQKRTGRVDWWSALAVQLSRFTAALPAEVQSGRQELAIDLTQGGTVDDKGADRRRRRT